MANQWLQDPFSSSVAMSWLTLDDLYIFLCDVNAPPTIYTNLAEFEIAVEVLIDTRSFTSWGGWIWRDLFYFLRERKPVGRHAKQPLRYTLKLSFSFENISTLASYQTWNRCQWPRFERKTSKAILLLTPAILDKIIS